MQTSQLYRSGSSLTWRIAGFWAVILALGLAVGGVILAIGQGQSLVVRLMAPAEMKVRQIAETAMQQFHGQLELGLGATAAFVREGADAPWDPPDNFPRWFDGLYVWNGHTLHVITTPVVRAQALFELVKDRLGSRFQRWDDHSSENAKLLYDTIDQSPAVLACLNSIDQRGRPVLIGVHVNLERLKSELLDPLLPSDGSLEYVDIAAVARDNQWSQQLFSAMRFWAVQPTQEFLDEQARTVFRVTVVQLALPALALLTLLIAMAVLIRAVRREVALATLKANFVADVSHELKTPLALIRLFAETLQAGRVTSDEQRNEYYDVILRESTRLTNLINNILDFSRIEAGRKEYLLEPIDVGSVVRDTYETYKPQLEQAGFEHHFSITDDLPTVRADRDAITQAIINLINNAIKYSDDERFLKVELSTDVRRGKRGVLISVHDRGIGIHPEDRARLFDGFFRATDRRVREKSGAGIGLGLVKHIIQSHGGTLDVESRLVKGSTFRIFLPGIP